MPRQEHARRLQQENPRAVRERERARSTIGEGSSTGFSHPRHRCFALASIALRDGVPSLSEAFRLVPTDYIRSRKLDRSWTPTREVVLMVLATPCRRPPQIVWHETARLSTVRVAAENVARVVTLYKTSVAPVLQVGGTILCLLFSVSLLLTLLASSGHVLSGLALSCLVPPSIAYLFVSLVLCCSIQTSRGSSSQDEPHVAPSVSSVTHRSVSIV